MNFVLRYNPFISSSFWKAKYSNLHLTASLFKANFIKNFSMRFMASVTAEGDDRETGDVVNIHLSQCQLKLTLRQMYVYKRAAPLFLGLDSWNTSFNDFTAFFFTQQTRYWYNGRGSYYLYNSWASSLGFENFSNFSGVSLIDRIYTNYSNSFLQINSRRFNNLVRFKLRNTREWRVHGFPSGTRLSTLFDNIVPSNSSGLTNPYFLFGSSFLSNAIHMQSTFWGSNVSSRLLNFTNVCVAAQETVAQLRLNSSVLHYRTTKPLKLPRLLMNRITWNYYWSRGEIDWNLIKISSPVLSQFIGGRTYYFWLNELRRVVFLQVPCGHLFTSYNTLRSIPSFFFFSKLLSCLSLVHIAEQIARERFDVCFSFSSPLCVNSKLGVVLSIAFFIYPVIKIKIVNRRGCDWFLGSFCGRSFSFSEVLYNREYGRVLSSLLFFYTNLTARDSESIYSLNYHIRLQKYKRKIPKFLLCTDGLSANFSGGRISLTFLPLLLKLFTFTLVFKLCNWPKFAGSTISLVTPVLFYLRRFMKTFVGYNNNIAEFYVGFMLSPLHTAAQQLTLESDGVTAIRSPFSSNSESTLGSLVAPVSSLLRRETGNLSGYYNASRGLDLAPQSFWLLKLGAGSEHTDFFSLYAGRHHLRFTVLSPLRNIITPRRLSRVRRSMNLEFFDQLSYFIFNKKGFRQHRAYLPVPARFDLSTTLFFLPEFKGAWFFNAFDSCILQSRLSVKFVKGNEKYTSVFSGRFAYFYTPWYRDSCRLSRRIYYRAINKPFNLLARHRFGSLWPNLFVKHKASSQWGKHSSYFARRGGTYWWLTFRESFYVL